MFQQEGVADAFESQRRKARQYLQSYRPNLLSLEELRKKPGEVVATIRDSTIVSSCLGFASIQKELILAARELLTNTGSRITFLVVGKTGEGKSTLVNSFVGKEVCTTGDLTATTQELREVRHTINGVDVSIYDTRGMLDGDGVDDEIFESIQGVSMNLLLLCVSMRDRANSQATKSIISMITKKLGITIWENAAIILTRANERRDWIEQRRRSGHSQPTTPFSEVVSVFTQTLRGYLRAARDNQDHSIPPAVIDDIPVLPAGEWIPEQTGIPAEGQERPWRELPGCADWLSNVWLGCFRRCSHEARLPIISINSHRLQVQTRDGAIRSVEEVIGSRILECPVMSSSEESAQASLEPSPPASRPQNSSSTSADDRSGSPTSNGQAGLLDNQTPIIQVREEDIPWDDILQGAITGAKIGSRITGFLGFALLDAAEQEEDGSTRRTILLSAGMVLAGLTTPPGAVCGFIAGTAFSCIRRIRRRLS